jgi:hypothetical protein
VRVKTERDHGSGYGYGYGYGYGPAAELRSSPRSSEEQAMTSNGIVRVSDIQREIDGIVKDIAVAGQGTYTGAGGRAAAAAAAAVTTNRGDAVRPVTPKTPRTPAARPRPSMETITIGATLVTPLPPRPGTSGSGVRRGPPERYYSESIYPEQGVGNGDDWDDDDRVSRYLDRRFGVVTPKGTTPTSKGWEGSGRPF